MAVAVTVVKIRVVRVLVTKRRMAMRVGVGLRDWPVVNMLVMVIMTVPVFMLDFVVHVFVFMPLRQVQP